MEISKAEIDTRKGGSMVDISMINTMSDITWLFSIRTLACALMKMEESVFVALKDEVRPSAPPFSPKSW